MIRTLPSRPDIRMLPQLGSAGCLQSVVNDSHGCSIDSYYGNNGELALTNSIECTVDLVVSKGGKTSLSLINTFDLDTCMCSHDGETFITQNPSCVRGFHVLLKDTRRQPFCDGLCPKAAMLGQLSCWTAMHEGEDAFSTPLRLLHTHPWLISTPASSTNL